MASVWEATTSGQRRVALVLALVIVAILTGTLAALSVTRGFKTGAAPPAAGSVTPTHPVGPLPPPVGRPAPRIAVPPPVAAIAAPQDDGDVAAPDDEDAERIAGAIERTTRKALRRGEPVRWHKAGEEGFVSVSEPRIVVGRVCRNVTATIHTEGGATQSRDHLWCASDEDENDWAPEG